MRLKSVGVQHVKISNCVVSNHPEENNAYHARIADQVRDEITAARSIEDENFQVVDHYHATPAGFEKDYHSCPITSLLTVIGADGCVYSCQDKVYTESGYIGSLQSVRFRDFWFTRKV